MNCRTFREQASRRVVELDLRGGERTRTIDPIRSLEQWRGDASEHGRNCFSCARHWIRLLVQVRLMCELTPVSAPADLEGRVVAALHPGHRQQRAVSAVASLPRLQAPPVLARRLDTALSNKAPSALLRRVEREIESSMSGDGRDELVRWSPSTAIVSASLLLLVLWAAGTGRTVNDAGTGPEGAQSLAGGDPAAGSYGFDVVRVDSPRHASLDASTRRWIDGLSGGMLGSVE